MMCSRVVWIFLPCVIQIVSISCGSPGKGESKLDAEDIPLCGKDCKHTASLGEALDIEDMDEPTLKKALESTSERGKIALQVWDPRDQKGTPLEDKLDVLINAISKEIVATIPEDIAIQPIEFTGDDLEKKRQDLKMPPTSKVSVYACFTKGSIRSKKIEKVNKRVEKIENGFKLVINYTFKELSLEYGLYYVKATGSSQGEFHLPYNAGNTVEITLQIPDSSKKIFNKLFNKQCIADITLVKMTELKLLENEFVGTVTGKDVGWFPKPVAANIENIFTLFHDEVVETFEQRILMQIHKALATQDTWICKDMGKAVSQKKFAPTEKFKKNCKDFDDK